MTIISTHVLDSVIGDHAGGIRIEFYRLGKDDSKHKLFDVVANHEGRIAEPVDTEGLDDELEYEFVFHSKAYFAAQPATPPSGQIMNVVVVRFTIPAGQDRIHIPLMLSPHNYSIWWSS